MGDTTLESRSVRKLQQCYTEKSNSGLKLSTHEDEKNKQK